MNSIVNTNPIIPTMKPIIADSYFIFFMLLRFKSPQSPKDNICLTEYQYFCG